MQLSVKFVNNLVAVLNVLASQVATALDTLNFALMTERNQQSDTRVSPRAPRNSRHGQRIRNKDRQRLRHLTRILMVQFVHIQVPHRSALLLRWFMDLANFYKNSPLPVAIHTVNLSRHGHRVSWMRWFDGRKTRIPGPPTKPLPGSFRNPLRKSSSLSAT